MGFKAKKIKKPKPRHVHVVAAQIRSGSGTHSDKRKDPNEEFLKEFEIEKENVMKKPDEEVVSEVEVKTDVVVAPGPVMATLEDGKVINLNGCLMPPVENKKAKKGKK